MKAKADAIWELAESFCRERLNEEYLAVCGRLLGVLARKRPSPLTNGTAPAWACGIVRTIGWVNFLDDPKQKPFMKMTEIDKAFDVSSSTGQTKSKSIRDLLRIGVFDPEWTLPGNIDANPMAWMITVNGFACDARSMPREIQEQAFAKGIIPYIPGDRNNDGESEFQRV